MNEVLIMQRLFELTEELNKLLRSSPSQGAKSEGVYLASRRGGQSELEELFEELTLQVKYLMFDLEATRRENRYLRQILENRPRPSGEEPKDPGTDSA
jgi:hypothetical protein